MKCINKELSEVRNFKPSDTKQKTLEMKSTPDKLSPLINQNNSQSNSRPTSDHSSDIDDLDLLDSSKVLTSVKIQSQPVDTCRSSLFV